MSTELDKAAEAFCPKTWSNDIGTFDTYEWEMRQKAFKAGAIWTLRESPEVKMLVEALEKYSSMKMGSTVTPKWANEALARFKAAVEK